MVWGTLAAGQALLLFLLMADSFELAETMFGARRGRRFRPIPAPSGARLPKVSIHLPICNEPPHMVRQTLDALAALDYDRFRGAGDRQQHHRSRAVGAGGRALRAPRAQFRFFTLGKWPGYKAGALNFALRETAPGCRDHRACWTATTWCEPDWLRCMVPQFDDPRVGFVQSPQDYRDNDGSFFKRLMFWEYAGFFQLGMVTRNERNAIIQHGTMTPGPHAGAARTSGGWAEWTHHRGRRAWPAPVPRTAGEAVYAPRSFGRGVMPDDFAAFRKQRFRWAYGAMQICRATAGALFNPFNRELTLGQRWHFITGWLPWIGDALGLAFLHHGPGVVGRADRWRRCASSSRSRCSCCPRSACSSSSWCRSWRSIRTACHAACGTGSARRWPAWRSATRIGKAVWKGLLRPRAPFLRTPKMEDAPALVQGLVMAREELVLLALTWGAALGVGFGHHLATLETKLWCAVLLTQSLPYLASVGVSILASMPAKQAKPVALPAAAKVPASLGAMHPAAGD